MAHGHTPLVMNEYDKKVDAEYETDVLLTFEPFTEETFKQEVNKVRANLARAAKVEAFYNCRECLSELVTAIDCYTEGDLQLIDGLIGRAKDACWQHWSSTAGATYAVDARKAMRGLHRIHNRWQFNLKKGGEI